NEAHVLLASSMWYVCRAVKILSALGTTIFALLVLGLLMAQSTHPLDARAALGIAIPMATGLSFWGLQHNIERSFHYQRTRELIHILELAHWMEDLGKAHIFRGLEPDARPRRRKR